MIVNRFPLQTGGGHIWGVEWDGTSRTDWTRTDSAVGFADPVPYVSGATSYGSPFDTLSPWKDMTIVEDSQAGTMVKIPKFWYKLTQTTGNGMKIQISSEEEDGFSVCPACMDRGDGSGERDYILVGRYHCATSTYKSTSDKNPARNFGRTAGRTSIHNLGSKVWMMDFATRFTIWLLYLVEFADWNSQAKIGYGCGSGTAVGAMGYTNSMPYHTGTTKTSRTTYGLGTQYRNIEGLWDNVCDWTDGCYYAKKDNKVGLYIIKNPANFSDSSGGKLVGYPGSNIAYPAGFSVCNVSGTFPMFISSNFGGSSTTYSCDKWGMNSTYPAMYAGGSYTNSGDYGLFYSFSYSASFESGTNGSRPMKLP